MDEDAALELAKALERHDAQERDLKELGETIAKIKTVSQTLIKPSKKFWCGDWMRRGCYKTGNLGEKCSNPDGCGRYMVEIYNQDAQAKFDTWFKDSNYQRVVCYQDKTTKERFYLGEPDPNEN